jgi:hypothetical protein
MVAVVVAVTASIIITDPLARSGKVNRIAIAHDSTEESLHFIYLCFAPPFLPSFKTQTVTRSRLID